MRAKTATTIRKPAQEVYDAWKHFERLPTFMWHLQSVDKIDEKRSHWVASGPAGTSVEWDAEITEDQPGRYLAWKSVADSQISNAGSIRFTPAPRDQGTDVVVEMEYEVPGGVLGQTVAKLFGEEPEQQIKDDVRRFKQVMETGEVVFSDGVPDGSRSQRQLLQEPGKPTD